MLNTNIRHPHPFINVLLSTLAFFFINLAHSGELNIKLMDADSGQAITNQYVSAYRLQADGSKTWTQDRLTDPNGQARFELDQLGDGASYVLRGSVYNGFIFQSAPISAAGTQSLQVGTTRVTLRNGTEVGKPPLTDVKVDIYALNDDGNRYYFGNGVSDANGQLKLDLTNINSTNQYYLEVQSTIVEDDKDKRFTLSTTGDHQLVLGDMSLTVKLIDGISAQPIAMKTIEVYQQQDNGSFSWFGQVNTDSHGMALFEELPQMSKGRRYQLKTRAFEGYHSHSELIDSNDDYDFVVGNTEIQVINGNSANQAPLSDTRVVIKQVNDNRSVYIGEAVSNAQGLVRYDLQDNGNVYQFETTSTLSGEIITSQLIYASGRHQFIVDGEAVTMASLPVTLVDEASNSPLANIQIDAFELMANGQQNLIAQSTTDSNGEVCFTLENLDSGVRYILQANNPFGQGQQYSSPMISNSTAFTFYVKQATETAQATSMQMARRITFGLTPQLLNQIKAGEDILSAQLNPDNIDDSRFEAEMAAMPINSKQDLKNYLLTYMAGSKKQLREVMAWFWENHFSTNINKHGIVSDELAENNLFRQHALGNFRQLLEISAKSPAMIHYLDNQLNVVGRANENYAREIMELHTLGVNGGYNYRDIAELAKIFTGWHQQNGAFAFNNQLHDMSDKTFLGYTIVGSGVAEGEQVLDILATHPSTGQFICAKLINLFITDHKLESLQNRCAGQFVAQNGNITATLQLILTSSEMNVPQYEQSKVKTPLELVLATARGFASQVNATALNQQLSTMGMSLMEYALPTGYSETADDWLNSNALLQRLKMVNKVAWHQHSGISIDFKQQLHSQGAESAEAVIGQLFELALSNQHSELEYQTALQILNQNQPFDINASQADEKLSRLLATVLSFPAFHYQ